jgi:hypothetical protein
MPGARVRVRGVSEIRKDRDGVEDGWFVRTYFAGATEEMTDGRPRRSSEVQVNAEDCWLGGLKKPGGLWVYSTSDVGTVYVGGSAL